MNKILKYFIILIGLNSCISRSEVDLIIHNAVIFTVDENFSMAEAMAIQGDSILEIGPEHEILNKYSSSTIIDAKKKFIYPGLIDAHSHFMGYAKNLDQLNLVGIESQNALINAVKKKVETSNSDWILGRGWDQTNWEEQIYPTNEWCDNLFPDKFIFLKRIDGHAALVSNNLLELAGIDENTEIEGGKILRSDGKCTGILIDNAIDTIQSLIPEIEAIQLSNLLKKAQMNCFEVGLTSVCDAGLDKADVEMLQEMSEKNELKLRLYIMLNPTDENFESYLSNGPIQNEQISITSFKFYCDGALGSRGALLNAPYADVQEEDYHGLLLSNEDNLKKWASELYLSGFQMNTHAIGDGANRLMLHIYANELKGVNDKRWRIEHAQVVNSSDLQYFQDYTIIPSVQPTHATSDMNWAIDRLGENRIETAYAFKSLKNQNGLIAFGTDFPVEEINPLYTLLAATKRTDTSGNPEGGYQIKESLSFEESLRAMTIWAAIANFEENVKGSLEVGKKADFVIFNKNLEHLDAHNLDDYSVEMTYLNGKEVYKKNQ